LRRAAPSGDEKKEPLRKRDDEEGCAGGGEGESALADEAQGDREDEDGPGA